MRRARWPTQPDREPVQAGEAGESRSEPEESRSEPAQSWAGLSAVSLSRFGMSEPVSGGIPGGCGSALAEFLEDAHEPVEEVRNRIDTLRGLTTNLERASRRLTR
jgi:hypothetical protein